MKPLSILHVTPTYLPALRYGGPIYAVHGLCKALAARGHRVEVFTTDVDGPGVVDVPLDRPVDRDGVAVRYFPCGVGRRLYRSPAMRRALEARLRDFDVAHLHASFLWPPLAAARAAERAGKPYLFAPRGMLVGELLRRKSRLIKTAWIALFERRTLARAAAVHVTSDIERIEIERLGLTARGFLVAPNGVEPPPVEARDDPAPARPYVLALGRIVWKKGLDRLIRAMARIEGADLVIAGEDDEDHAAALRALAVECGLGARLRLVGPTHGAGKWRLLRDCALLALPSLSENFGNVALEAMAVGAPVVVTPGVGLSQSIAAAGAGLVVDGSPDSLAAAIGALLADPARRAAMGAAGRALAARDFSWPAVAEKVEAAYAQAIEESRRGEG